MAAGRSTLSKPRWQHRVAGGLMAAVGAVNAVFGGWALAGGALDVTAAVAAGLVGAGLLTLVAGVLVWRGSRVTTLVALTVFGLLLLVQLTGLVEGVGPETQDLVRLVVLAALVAALALAARRQGG